MTKFRISYKLILTLPILAILSACSTNQATGRNQFTGFLPVSQEASIGAQEHEKILAQYGGMIQNRALQDYVTSVGNKIVPYTERKDVNYTFTVLDSPIVNAFALPGGYVYVTRGLLALANSEAEMAAVIAHEIGHVTARHSAERYSTSVLTSIGASIAAAAINVDGAGQALGLGANLYLSSYSRSQEHEADDLGIRYLSRAGYDPDAMADFLKSLEAHAQLEAREAGRDQGQAPSYLSTHPVTANRIARSITESGNFPDGGAINRIDYLKAINGMTIGDSASQGFVTNGKFVHPELGFIFNVPSGFKTENQPQAFIAQGANGATLLFTAAKKPASQSMEDFLRQTVLKGDMSGARDFGSNVINGMQTASVEKSGTLNGKPANMRIVAFQWDADSAYLFTLAMPQGVTAAQLQQMQDAVFSFNRLSAAQKARYRPKSLTFRVAGSGDTVSTMAARYAYDDGLNEMRFRVINGLYPNGQVQANGAYKVIVQ
jgi:predicted Zn-dependent protease